MCDRESCRFPYFPFAGLIVFLTGMLVLVLRSRRRAVAGIPHQPTPAVRAIVLPDTMPTGVLPAPDDLTVIEGIGLKVQSTLQAAGISRMEQLARATPAGLRSILAAAGNRISNPDTWPEQASLVASGKWDEFNRLVESLKGGRRA